jgi:hypothetical protein
MNTSSLTRIPPVSIPEFSGILHNDWDDTSFVGHDGEKFIELKNCSLFPKLVNRLFISQDYTGRAIDKILDTFHADNPKYSFARLRPFHHLWQNNWGLFTKAEFREFCQKHHISVPDPNEL